jgi:tetratricopeptide (TPR) repeat protein
MRILRTTRLAALLLALTSHAAADLLCLKDGRVVEGRKLSRAEGGGVVVHFENGEVRVPAALIEDYVIEGEPPPAPTTPEDIAQAEKGLVRFEGKWVTPRRRDDLIAKRVAERKAKLDELASHRLWRNRYSETTKHFAFEHTLPKDAFEDLRDLMEAYFTAFCKDWRIKPPKDLGPLKVCLYHDYDQFLQVGVGTSNSGMLAYYRFVRPLELNFFYERLDRDFTAEVMFHEANHYLQHLIDLGFGYPHFPGESLAEYYGASHFDPKTKKLTTGLILEGRLTEVQTDFQRGEWMDLEKLITTEGMYEHYTWGWSLVHFLMSDKRYSAKFQKFFTSLPEAKGIRKVEMGRDNLRTIEQKDVLGPFMEALGLKDKEALGALQEEWHAYVKELPLVSARGYEEAAYKAASMYPPRPIKAKRLFEEALALGAKNPMTYHRFAELLHREGEHDRALGLWKQAVEIDPLIGEFYWGMARATRAKGKKDEAKRLSKLAREIDPEIWHVDLEELEEAEAAGK